MIPLIIFILGAWSATSTTVAVYEHEERVEAEKRLSVVVEVVKDMEKRLAQIGGFDCPSIGDYLKKEMEKPVAPPSLEGEWKTELKVWEPREIHEHPENRLGD